jgi:hypothetical protein
MAEVDQVGLDMEVLNWKRIRSAERVANIKRINMPAF